MVNYDSLEALFEVNIPFLPKYYLPLNLTQNQIDEKLFFTDDGDACTAILQTS